jgi:hypothetical protein
MGSGLMQYWSRRALKGRMPGSRFSKTKDESVGVSAGHSPTVLHLSPTISRVLLFNAPNPEHVSSSTLPLHILSLLEFLHPAD